MKRDQLFQIAAKYRDEYGKIPADARARLRRELIDYFNSPEGKQVLEDAPRVMIEVSENVFDDSFPLQDQPVGRLVDLIMQEVK